MLTLDIKGMTCGHCVKAVTRAIESVDPQAKVAIDLATGRAQIESSATPQAIGAAVVEEGYEVLAARND